MATNGPDTLIGTDGADTISGLGGDDVIYGMSGANDSPIAGRINVVRVGAGFDNVPVYASSAPGDPDHLYVLTKDDGRIVKLDPSDGSKTLFLDIADDQFLGGGERGVLGLAFAPDFATSGLFYVDLTKPVSGDIEIRQYHFSGSGTPTFEHTVLGIPHPNAGNHNGGQLAFGPDGFLYISVGDGGTGGANSQDKDSLLGKILRIDPSGDDFPADATRNYAIPAGNPFAGATAGADEIWAFGLRNPWRLSFDTLTGDLYIGDVGQSTREEIDFQAAGAPGGRNYGWPAAEGTLGTPPPGATPPIFEYDHSLGNVVTGGMVYRELGEPLFGAYFFIDEGSDRFWTLKVVNGQATAVADRTEQLFSPDAPVATITSFGQDGNGNLYMVGFGGDIFRLDMTPFAGDLADHLHGGAGNDRIYGGPGADTLFGEADGDFLSGGYGNDLLLGGAGNDVLMGGPGNDVMRGGPNNDIYVVNAAADLVVEGSNAGRDTVQSPVSLVLPANIEVLRLLGTRPIDGTGNGAGNMIVGNAGANQLSGAGGNDVVDGGLGADRLTGGAGKDGFLFNTRLGHGNIDRIIDFAPAADTIDLDNAFFHGLAAGFLAPAAFFAGAAAHDANDRIIYHAATGTLILDVNGSAPGGAVVFATVVNHAALTHADFFVF